VLIVGKIFDDGYVGPGIALMVVGLAVIGGAYGLATALREAPDVDEGLAAGHRAAG
jgi:hypothetical protein